MDKRVFVRIDDDDQLDRIQDIAEQLRGSGLAVSEVSPVVGQITGTIAPDRLDHVREKCRAMGVRLEPEEGDVEHRLPPPDSELQ